MLTSLLTLYIAATLQPTLALDHASENKNYTSIKTASVQLFPSKNSAYINPIIEAKSTIAIDLKTGMVLYEKNIHERLPIASITKLMTILIILEENKLNEIVTVSNNAANTEGSQMHLRADEQISLENLLYGSLIHSANDAAVALAEHNSGNVEKFVEKMNKRALELGLINTSFSNPIGLDGPKNYSSAYDIAKLGSFLYEDPFVKTAANIKTMEVKSVDGNYIHKLESTNDILDSYLKIKGLKTGQTNAAGLCLMAIAENSTGQEIATVVLNSPARFKETKFLIDWVFRAYNWN